MDVFVQIVASGLTLGAMYAVSSIGLALVYGSLNMLNMAHGALLALGGYVCLHAMTALALPAPLALLAAMAVCGAAGLLIYLLAARPMLSSRNFETRIFIATIGIGAVLESTILRVFGAQPAARKLRTSLSTAVRPPSPTSALPAPSRSPRPAARISAAVVREDISS